ncbi:MAG: sulfotransferase domain-containing protein [Gammaproteobacteria bacterium]|nr:sulfotransferase domain-containing protein [Gammaproteobacteria bacterium]NNL51387.1 hypothetical protein [Woeseiaceae bacterium]
MRDPLARAVSQYFHEKRRGIERLPLIEALSTEPARIAGEATKLEDPRYQSHAFGYFTYVTRGLYADQLRSWYRYFDRAQLLVLESEMLRISPHAVLSGVAQFLGFSRWRPNVSKMHNQGGTYSAPDEVVDWLKTRFAGPNRELCELLGRELSWAVEGRRRCDISCRHFRLPGSQLGGFAFSPDYSSSAAESSRFSSRDCRSSRFGPAVDPKSRFDDPGSRHVLIPAHVGAEPHRTFSTHPLSRHDRISPSWTETALD